MMSPDLLMSMRLGMRVDDGPDGHEARDKVHARQLEFCLWAAGALGFALFSLNMGISKGSKNTTRFDLMIQHEQAAHPIPLAIFSISSETCSLLLRLHSVPIHGLGVVAFWPL